MEEDMGLVHAEITLKNAFDVRGSTRGIIGEAEIRQVTVQAMVDTGAGTLVINEAIRQKLGLAITGKRFAVLADGSRQEYPVTEPIDVHWKNRETSCRALVLSAGQNVLLGAIPLEDMDLIVDPTQQQLTGAHGDEVVTMVCRV